MAKKKVQKLKRKIAKLKAKLAKGSTASKGALVSPLAPVGGFPELPVIQGVRFAAIESGLRYKGRPDVALIELSAGTTIAGAFTKSATRAAPVLDCQRKIGGPPDGGAAILVNAGNANAFTGANGLASVAAITGAVANALNIQTDRVFSSSTGVIGETLPHQKIVAKIDELAATLDPGAGAMSARAIMTTDTFAKGACKTFECNGGTINISGFAKGSGMIAPDMATMLVYIFTDARIPQPELQGLVSQLVETSFNCITVDSDTSTSDTVLVAATGKTDAKELTDLTSEGGRVFATALNDVMMSLAHQVVKDGEGATKFVEIRLSGAVSKTDAKTAALAVANSPLVKTAIAGEDPNWGRIVMAVGKSGATADRDKLSIRFGDIMVAENGWVSPGYKESAGAAYMKGQELVISVDLGVGDHSATVWTCDLTKRYIEINTDYRS